MEIILLIGVILCPLVWTRCHKKQEKPQIPQDHGKAALLEETMAVISDFLEQGKAVCAAGGSYQGTISVRLHERSRGNFGYTVCMYDTGDLRELPVESIRENRLEDFLRRYGNCYDSARNALVYTTFRTASLTAEEAGDMEGERYRRTKALPLAQVVTNTVLQTKGL